MAEILGIAGSIVSLTGLISQLISFSDFCSNLRDIPEDIQHIATEIATLRLTLNTSGLYSQQLESQGFDAGEFRHLHLETSKWLKEIEQTLEACTAKAKLGRGLTLGKRMRLLLKKKKIGHQVAAVERMKATLMVATLNTEGLINRTQHADTQASINDLRSDLKPILLDIQTKINQAAVGSEHSMMGCGKVPPQNAEIKLRRQEQTETKSEGRNRAPSGNLKTPQPPRSYTSELEEFAENPFHLLVACIFLNTKRQGATSQARNLFQRFPTPETLAKAQYHEVQPFFAHLGLFQRANWIIRLADVWLVCPPQTNKLYTKRGGKVTFRSEVAHFQGIGNFANDAWRIYCKDDMYIRAGYSITIPEWKKIFPTDEGLKACLRNRWDKEGFVWDENTGRLQERDVGLLDEESATSTDTADIVIPSSSLKRDYGDVMSTVHN